ncbi:hypothetical protein RR46_01983 [Papilio xuthus]|uniref:Uncharacterized protein n=1 Tax=Papilio xuthus TaxID=66420 RepID=A0A194QI41_PAPXU|nr:hypothetical protein RR46_01983 [Papilio xuthus]
MPSYTNSKSAPGEQPSPPASPTLPSDVVTWRRSEPTWSTRSTSGPTQSWTRQKCSRRAALPARFTHAAQ